MPLTLALHHEQNMPAVKSKIHPAPPYTWKCTKSCFIYMCNVWQVSGCKWKSRRLFGRSRTVKYGLFRWGGGVRGGGVFAVWANGTLPKSWGPIWRVRLKPFGECRVNYKVSGQTVCLLRSSVTIRLFTRLCKFIMSWRESSSGFFSLGTKDKHSGDASDQDQRITLKLFMYFGFFFVPKRIKTKLQMFYGEPAVKSSRLPCCWQRPCVPLNSCQS